jgi:hypothetical protein
MGTPLRERYKELFRFRSGVWHRLGHRFTAMAGIAGKLGLASEVLAVVLADHHDHRAGDILLGVLVAGEVALNVAAGALHTESGGESAHHGTDFVVGQDFQVLVGHGAAFFLTGGGLGKEGQSDQDR